MSRNNRKVRFNEEPHVFTFYEFTEQLKRLLERVERPWSDNVPFADIAGNFTEEALEKWITDTMDIGRIILRIAYGFAIANGDYSVDVNRIEEALEAYKRGIKKATANYEPNNV